MNTVCQNGLSKYTKQIGIENTKDRKNIIECKNVERSIKKYRKS
jgi:hypothetical protein